MGGKGSHEHEHDRETASAAAAGSPQDAGAPRGAAAATPAASASQGRPERRRNIAAGLIGAIAATLLSLVFILTFLWALHAPGPRAVPVGVADSPAQVSAVSSALDHQAPGGFNVIGYPSEPAARNAILTRVVDAALVPGPSAPLLLTASAAGPAVTSATVKAFQGAIAASTPFTVQDIRPLPPNDPDSLSQVFVVVALLTPSLVFGRQLVTRIRPAVSPLLQVPMIAVYAAIVGAVTTVLADPVIGALTGAPWGLFGIGTLLAFAAAVVSAAAARWASSAGYLVITLLFIAIGIPSSGVTLGPNMITAWYADLGKALPPGTAMPAIKNTVYFSGSNITAPLLILSAWALAGILAMVMAAILHPPLRGQGSAPADRAGDATAAARQPPAAS